MADNRKKSKESTMNLSNSSSSILNKSPSIQLRITNSFLKTKNKIYKHQTTIYDDTKTTEKQQKRITTKSFDNNYKKSSSKGTSKWYVNEPDEKTGGNHESEVYSPSEYEFIRNMIDNENDDDIDDDFDYDDDDGDLDNSDDLLEKFYQNKTMQNNTDSTLSDSKSKFYCSNYDARDELLFEKKIKDETNNDQADYSSDLIDFRPSIPGESFVYSLKTVKCTYSSDKTNEKNEYINIDIKGKLILTTYKLIFKPHKEELIDYEKCHKYKSQFFKYWNENEIPLTFIYGIYTSNDKSKRIHFSDMNTLADQRPKEMVVICKNFLTKCFSFNNENYIVDRYEDFFKFFKCLLHYSNIQSVTKLCTFSFESNIKKSSSQDNVLQLKQEPFRRNSVAHKRTRFFSTAEEINDDIREQKCDRLMEVGGFNMIHNDISSELTSKSTIHHTDLYLTLPAAIPISLNDGEVLKLGLFCENRIPIWSFTYPNSCSLVTMPEGLPNKLKDSEELIRKYNSILCTWQRMVAQDTYICGDALNDAYLKKKVPLKHHKLKMSFDKLVEICAYRSTRDLLLDDDRWRARLHDTKWIKYIGRLLETTFLIIEGIVDGKVNVIIEEQSNKDISCVLTSLVKLCLFDKCRTIIGFQELIQKEWFYVGHMFSKRLQIVNHSSSGNVKLGGSGDTGSMSQTSTLSSVGSGVASSNALSASTSNNNNSPSSYNDTFTPVFFIFLDCVWQLLIQFPHKFEFNETYLITLLDYSISGISVTFSFNGLLDWKCYVHEYNHRHDKNEAENSNRINDLIDSNWKWSKHLNIPEPERYLFLNTQYDYKRDNEVLRPNYKIHRIQFWSSCYLRWYRLGGDTSYDEIKCQVDKRQKDDIVELVKEQRIQSSLINVPEIRQSSINSFAGYLNDYKKSPSPGKRNNKDEDHQSHELLSYNYNVQTRRTADGNIESSL